MKESWYSEKTRLRAQSGPQSLIAQASNCSTRAQTCIRENRTPKRESEDQERLDRRRLKWDSNLDLACRRSHHAPSQKKELTCDVMAMSELIPKMIFIFNGLTETQNLTNPERISVTRLRIALESGKWQPQWGNQDNGKDSVFAAKKNSSHLTGDWEKRLRDHDSCPR